MIKHTALFFSVFIALSGPVFAQDIHTIDAVCAQWSGYTHKDGTGAYWEVLKAVFEPAGITVNTRVMPWKRAKITVEAKKADVLIGDYYSQSEDGVRFLYPRWHISVEDPVIAVFQKRAGIRWDKKGIASLSGRSVGWIKGYGFEQTLFSDVRVSAYEVPSTISGLKMLKADRIHALLDYESEIRVAAEKIKLDLSRRYVAKIAKSGSRLFAVFSNTERSESLVRIFDTRMTILAKSGKIEAIYEKWGHGKDKFGRERYHKE